MACPFYVVSAIDQDSQEWMKVENAMAEKLLVSVVTHTFLDIQKD